MTDIVEYLMMRRADGALFNPSGPTAADTIVTLRAEIERLRERLEWAAAQLGANGLAAQAFHTRAALAEEKQNDR